MLKRLYVDNYRCFVNFQLEFQELTLLVGANGSGKSSVLDLLSALRQLLSGTGKVSDPALFPTRSLTRWQDRPFQVVEITAGIENAGDLTYRLEIEHEKDSRRARIVLESLTADQKPLFEFRMGEVQLYRDDHIPGARYGADWSESAMARVVARPINHRLSAFLEIMRGMSLCALDPKRFQAESYSEEPLLQADGANFSSWYRHQIQERQDLAIDFVEILRKVLDGFHSVRLEKVSSETRAFHVDFESESGRYPLRLDELSDGQRALIALYALIHLAGEKDILFLDEPDNYLALAEIQPWLMTLSDACGTRPRQAILCSHHPELMDYLGGEAGVLLKRERSGAITTQRLDVIRPDSGLKLSEIVARGWEP
jgi:ATPase subunit of ABC transporter with duplicated ATPase domains